MSLILTWVIAAILAASFYQDSDTSKLLFQLWWIPLLISFLYLQLRIVPVHDASSRSRLFTVIVPSVAMLCFILFFNNTATAFLTGILILTAISVIVYRSSEQISGRPFACTAALVALSLVLMPVGINRVSIKLPSLSGQTHFTIFNTSDSSPIPSAHHHQRILDYEELELQLSAAWYPGAKMASPILEIRNDQDGVKFVLQEINYRQVVGLFRKTLFTIEPMEMNSVLPLTQNSNAVVSYPDNGGLRIEDLPIGETIRFQLPAIPDDTISMPDKAMTLATRLILWLLAVAFLVGWRPRRNQIPLTGIKAQ